MANPTKTNHYDKWRPGLTWKDPVILFSPVPIEAITIRAVTLSTDLGIMDFGEFVQTTGDETDLEVVSLAADNSTTIACIVPDTEWNLQKLAEDNDVDTYSGLTKATACFKAGTEIDVVVLIPGLIVATKVIDSVGAGGYKPFTRVQSAGSGRVDVYVTAGAQLGFLLSQVYNLAAVQAVAVLVQRGY